jgi:hypothetical protein
MNKHSAGSTLAEITDYLNEQGIIGKKGGK